MARYAVQPERDLNKGGPEHEGTHFVGCAPAEAEHWAVYGLSGEDPTLEGDFPTKAEADAWVSAHAMIAAPMLREAAGAGLDAMAASLAASMGWTSGDFLPCQLEALQHALLPVARTLAGFAVANGLTPDGGEA